MKKLAKPSKLTENILKKALKLKKKIFLGVVYFSGFFTKDQISAHVLVERPMTWAFFKLKHLLAYLIRSSAIGKKGHMYN